MAAEIVTYAVDGRVGIVTINRPDKLNAITLELKHALVERSRRACHELREASGAAV